MSQHDLAMKAVGPMQFADDDQGEVRAVVYTLGVVDNDGEVLLPETFTGSAPVMISHYGHSAVLAHAKGASVPVEAPVGKGTITAKANGEIELTGKYFMSTQAGRDAYFTAKEMGGDQQWSFTFWRDAGMKPDADWAAKGARRVWKNAITPFEVSPVTVAGGLNTRTLAVRSADDPDLVVEYVTEPVAQADGDSAVSEAVAETPAEAPAPEPVETEEQKAAREAEAKAAADREVEAKAAKAAEVALKAQKDEAMEEYARVQRALKRMGLA